jgi:cytidylate kinase
MMTTISSLERFLDGQLQAWCQRNEEENRNGVGPVIAITRQPGCDGESIAKTLAKEFGLVLYDREIVEQIAEDTHVSEKMVATLGEKFHSELEDWLADFAGCANLSSCQYMKSLRSVLFTIATHGNAVILGRGANFILSPEKRTLGLCLVAPLEKRVRSIMQELLLSQEDALKHITRKEREQWSWIKEHCQADLNDATHYHMTINTALVKTETIVQVAREMIRASLSGTCPRVSSGLDEKTKEAANRQILGTA